MLNQIPQLFLILLAQGSGTAPPPPKMDGPSPPVGDLVPIDSSIWVLALAAIAIGVYYFYSIRKAYKLSN
jgi:hypothetical protein